MAELLTALPKLGLSSSEGEASRLLKKYDKDKDGVLKLTEFDALVGALLIEQAPAIAERKKEEKVDASIKMAFKMFDVDGDGGLDAVELVSAFAKLARHHS